MAWQPARRSDDSQPDREEAGFSDSPDMVEAKSQKVLSSGKMTKAMGSESTSIVSQRAMEGGRIKIYISMILFDSAIIISAFLISSSLYIGIWPPDFRITMVPAFLPVFIVIANYEKCYSIRSLDDLEFSIRQMGRAILISAMICAAIVFYVRSAPAFSRITLSIALVLSFLGMAIFRKALVVLLRRRFGPSVSGVLLVLDGGPEIEIAGAQVIRTDSLDISGARANPTILDKIGREMRGMDRVVVSCADDRRTEWALVMRYAGVRGEVFAPAVQDLGALSLHHDGGLSYLVVSVGPLALRARVLKRLADIAISSVALIVLGPLMLLLAVLIKLEDGGPVFFVQRRMGRHNCLFNMLKFRSMRPGHGDSEGSRSASRSGEGVTRVGAIMRRTSMDELPQLINVLRSEMSVVGPRPHALGSQAGEKLFWEVDAGYWSRHSLKPGLTGLAQIRGYRGATETEGHLVDRLGADLEYISTWSLLGDLKIMIATARVLVHPNAY